MSNLEHSFEKAAEEVKNLVYRPGNNELLKLYALYKQATIGDNDTQKPGIFDLQGRAKWNAWKDVKGLSEHDAKQQYVAFVDMLKSKQ